MPETCPYCGQEFANNKALGSHLHYRHGTNGLAAGFEMRSRSGSARKRFRSLLEKCLLDSGLKMPRDIEKIELALTEIPRGISSVLDKYRDAFACALNKEKILKEAEEILQREEPED